MIWLKAVAVWLLLIAAESLNGTLRMLWLIPVFGDVRGEQISFVIGSLLVLAIPILLLPWLQISRQSRRTAGGVRSQLFGVGILWLILTVGFEILLGRFVLGYSWEQIARDYNIRQGGLMPFGLLLLTCSPLIAAKVRGILRDRRSEAS